MHPIGHPGLPNPLKRHTLAAWLPLALPLLLGSAAPLPAAAQKPAPVLADEPVRQATAQLQDLGAMLRPVARRDRAPTLLAMAAWIPPAAAAQSSVLATATAAAAAAATTATTAALASTQVLAAATTLPVPRAPTPLAAAAPRLPASPPVAESRFDLAINNAPAAQVFLQLAQGSAYNMLVSPDVSGTLSITLKDTSVLEALDTLRELFGYEFRVTGNRIFIYPNTVQTRLYRINYLPGRRQGASDIRVSSSAITTSGAGASIPSSGSSNTSSGPANRPDDNAHVRTTSDADFWREVQSSLAALVGAAGGRSVVLNPAAGVVVVKATPAELRQVEQYLKAVQISIERQVMLEAKIVEVSLSKDAQTGINWAAFGKLGNGQLTLGSAAPGTKLGNTGELSGGGNAINPGVGLAASALGRGFYGLAFQAANFTALLNFLETQGDVQVLSSPRIATLNNQKAVLKVGSDELYVTGISSNTTSNGTSTVTTPTLTLQPFFSGISLDVTPQIDDAGNVMLHVHPTISRVTEKNKDIDLGTQGVFRLPLASSAVNETDSIVRVKDGQIVAIGGLMKTELRDERTGLPVVGDLPVVGGLFRQTSTIVSKRELVIMLKPTIIHEDGSWPDAPAFGAASMQPPLTAAKP
jgi:MSHA biogenesis protein MshL